MEEGAPFLWQRYPETEKWLLSQLERLSSGNTALAQFSKDLVKYTSSRIFDWVSHIKIKEAAPLLDLGFTEENEGLFAHFGAQFPRVRIVKDAPEGVVVVVDEISNFFMCHHISNAIEGTPFSPYRRGVVSVEETSFEVIERRGTREITPINESSEAIQAYLTCRELWQRRPREGYPDLALLDQAINLAQEICNLLGQDRAAYLVLEVEREYWQSKNRAGQIQKARQDRLGLGWSNHDHHTFRSSRHTFRKLIELFEVLGFTCRERFYAGEEAGWGAQIMENNRVPAVLFLDVDLDPHEIAIDYEWSNLNERNELGTVGLWCALHGDSILSAGMHHLEAQFTFEQLKSDLEECSIEMMQPFSDFSYLKQAFTKGEVWHVKEDRLQNLLKKSLITNDQAEKFRREGAIGSHLENLQRREGYKGFNQKNVSYIIAKTDPRKQ